MRKLFGTDGIRGTANSEPITAATALAVAQAAGLEFRRGDPHRLVVIGKDTRLSGYLLESALTAGFVSVGMDVVLLGPLPTPAVAMLTRSLRADLGVVISASHNPYSDNGIKLFGPDGYKLSGAAEQAIEARVARGADGELAPSERLGQVRRLDDQLGRYIEFVKNSFPRGLRLDGLKIVVDCANGAAYRVAPTVFYELGAEVVPMAVEPDGFNINQDCGATAPGKLCQAVLDHGADLGIALDGDADRMVMADERGRLVDGDQILGLIARSWQEAEILQGGGIVGTVMANLGLERYLDGLGLELLRTPVGDRYVVERMREGGYNLGGEQSGHIVLSDYSTTGDGLIAALQVLAVLVQDGGKASQVTRVFEPLPQVLKNVPLGDAAALGDALGDAAVREAVAAGERALGSGGRLLIRKSGTEPVVRVMGEGEDEKTVGEVVETIARSIAKAAG
jgi:phosphoglucosamine mutase